jgi:hypothetical protein
VRDVSGFPSKVGTSEHNLIIYFVFVCLAERGCGNLAVSVRLAVPDAGSRLSPMAKNPAQFLQVVQYQRLTPEGTE